MKAALSWVRDVAALGRQAVGFFVDASRTASQERRTDVERSQMKTITKEAQFYELFDEAMRVFEENTLVTRYGMTTEHGNALRDVCSKYEAAFEPHDYQPLVTLPGSFAGRVGGPHHPDNPYVSVPRDGALRFS